MSELNTQVSMMAEIYGKAERVVVWSGKESEENDAVIEKLHYLRRHSPERYLTTRPGRNVSPADSKIAFPKEGIDLLIQ